MHNNKKIIALIPARAGSKGLPDKNVKSLANKPLIAWTIEQAKRSKYTDEIIVSTEDKRIANIAKEYGIDIPFLRPQALARDEASLVDVSLHLLEWLKNAKRHIPDFIVLLQPTSPLRESSDIDEAIETLASHNEADAIAGISEASENPCCARVINRGGFIDTFIKNVKAYERRQDMPPAYKVNGAIYICKTNILLKEKTFLPQKTLGYIMPPERAVDIDTIVDFKLAQLLLDERALLDENI